MAKSKTATEESEPTDDLLDEGAEADLEAEEAPEELGDDWNSVAELAELADDDADDETVAEGDETAESDAVATQAGSDDEALDELEAEELEMLTDDEASEALVVDEAQELRAIRRAEISMETDAGSERASDEFVCQSCFLVLKSSQLADKRRKYCRDCAG